MTTVVGLDDGLYAVTDGYSVQYFNHRTQGESILHQNAWPQGLVVEPSYGFASVLYRDAISEYEAKSLSSRSVMMGCRCDDDDEKGMSITCGYAFYERMHYLVLGSAEDDLISQVVFQVGRTALSMRCISTEITVKTLRWPSTRLTNNIGYNDDFLQGVADAAVWVRPRCSSNTNELSCLQGFRGADCFPYCMALRVKGSGSSRLVLHSADSWKSSVQLMRRDCVIASNISPLQDVQSVVELDNILR